MDRFYPVLYPKVRERGRQGKACGQWGVIGAVRGLWACYVHKADPFSRKMAVSVPTTE